LKKNCSHAERGFWGFGEALAKAQVCKTLKLSRNEAKTPKDRFFTFPNRMVTVFMKML
jgi:hypothetical protein